MGCNFVNYIMIIDRFHCNALVLCPTCGGWGVVQRKGGNTLGVRHKDGTRCPTTWHPSFQIFARNVHSTVLRTNILKMKTSIRGGKYIVSEYQYLHKMAPNSKLNTTPNMSKSSNNKEVCFS
jgi:hypothetical protein